MKAMKAMSAMRKVRGRVLTLRLAGEHRFIHCRRFVVEHVRCTFLFTGLEEASGCRKTYGNAAKVSKRLPAMPSYCRVHSELLETQGIMLYMHACRDAVNTASTLPSEIERWSPHLAL